MNDDYNGHDHEADPERDERDKDQERRDACRVACEEFPFCACEGRLHS